MLCFLILFAIILLIVYVPESNGKKNILIKTNQIIINRVFSL